MDRSPLFHIPRILHPGWTRFRGADHRPNASGFGGLVHLKPVEGPQYQDVLDYLDPAAARRLGFEYVHAPDTWVEGLPDEAVSRLNDPRLFESLSATVPRASTECWRRS